MRETSVYDTALHQRLQALALDALALGVIVTDRRARLVYANEAARRILTTPSSALRLRGGKISSARLAEHAGLSTLIAWAAGPGGWSEGGRDFLLAAGCGSETPDLAICVMPMERRRVGGPDGNALLLLRVIERECNLEVEARRLFGLTKAEARFASAMASGLSLTEAADLHAVSQETARSHMKSIFRKTGLCRQSQVAALMRGVQIPLRPIQPLDVAESTPALSAWA